MPSLADLPHPAELALLAVGPDRIEAQLQAAADAGTPALLHSHRGVRYNLVVSHWDYWPRPGAQGQAASPP